MLNRIRSAEAIPVKGMAVGSSQQRMLDLALPPNTLWMGNIPHDLAKEKSIIELLEKHASVNCVEKITLRLKDDPRENGQQNRSWGFVTFR